MMQSSPEDQRRLEAARELRRRGGLSAQQEAALDELERRFSAPPPTPDRPEGFIQRGARAGYEALEGPAMLAGRFADNPIAGMASDTISMARQALRPPGVQETIVPQAGASQQLRQGAMMGFGDEAQGALTGAIRAGIYGGDASAIRDDATQQARQQIGAAREARPVESMATEAAGAMAPFGAAGLARSAPGIVGQVASAVSPIGARNTLGTALRTGLSGAAAGSVTGAGEAEGDAGDRLTPAVVGGTLGAGIGLVSPAAGAVASRFGGSLVRAVQRWASGDANNMTRGQRRAMAEIRGLLQEDGMTPREAAETLRRWHDSGFDDAVLADVGPPQGAFQRRLRAAGTAGGQASRDLQGLLDRRLETQLERVTGTIERTFGGSPNVRQEIADMTRQRAETARPLYDAFRAQPGVSTSVIRDLGFAGSPTFQGALRTALREAADEADANDIRALRAAIRGSGDVTELNPDADLPPSVLDRIKQALDSEIETALSGVNPNRTAARSISRLRERFVNFLDEQYPDTYAQARQAYAGDSALISALQLGQRALRGDVEEVEAIARSMGPSEREMYQTGLARAILERVEGARDNTDFVARVIGTEGSRRRIRAAFDSDEAYEQFVEGLRNEQQRIRTARFLAPASGSQTASRQAEMSMDPLDIGWSIVRGRIGSVMGRLGATASRVGGQAQRAAEVARRLENDRELVALATRVMSENDPVMRETVLRDIAQSRGDQAAQQIRDAIRLSTIPAAQQPARGGE